MGARELAIPGAWEITPRLNADARGTFYEWFTEHEFGEMTGHTFEMQQANCSVSAAGVLRGLHFSQSPPSQAKYVTCLKGSVFDVVVDVRTGSPTHGQWDSVLLDDVDRRSTYISEGLAHGFLALQDDSTVMYLCSEPYAPQREHAISAYDPEIGIDWPLPASELRLSDRDAAAPTLAEVRSAGLLPDWEQTRAFVAGLRLHPRRDH
ncbi:dTDP-4-dehydrorhamnose 3,5-epimerase [Mycolicibacterium sp.]|jgi:dTDP-4-dehydrorhamnose 3,5-epimerase|uniref:dTDP-4-dehydrorhamnose 3,5-epimerase n=1 Tax=Mycolicibacterium sp. TaxID=2320850 RepID=UPI001A28FD37|nr:dTDP-4-dehydrorhamnose 3,5-epimerase [Mycolicibacterium sp.]MBJ7401418.1 dTDP-4-dehydrorhamnose 3,5-epimerase [Mycolicibacterium sp.]